MLTAGDRRSKAAAQESKNVLKKQQPHRRAAVGESGQSSRGCDQPQLESLSVRRDALEHRAPIGIRLLVGAVGRYVVKRRSGIGVLPVDVGHRHHLLLLIIVVGIRRIVSRLIVLRLRRRQRRCCEQRANDDNGENLW